MGFPGIIGCGSAYIQNYQDTQITKKELIGALLRSYIPESFKKNDIILATDSKGRPGITSRFVSDLFVSFSYCKNRIWAVLAVGTTVGIDVESPLSFSADYPYRKVFSQSELALVEHITSSPSSAAAALWTCKEAAVKAAGTGFLALEPAKVQISDVAVEPDGFTCIVGANHKYRASVRREGTLWKAIATY